METKKKLTFKTDGCPKCGTLPKEASPLLGGLIVFCPGEGCDKAYTLRPEGEEATEAQGGERRGE